MSTDAKTVVETYLMGSTVPRLQLGAGANILDGWLNTDKVESYSVMALDTSRPFPIEDASFSFILSEHHIEHMSYFDGQAMLSECYRILTSDGVLRISTPDLNRIVELLTDAPTAEQAHYIAYIADNFLPNALGTSAAFVVNNAFYNWGHRFLYDEPTLRAALAHAGFKRVTRFEPGIASSEHLRDVEQHGAFLGDVTVNRYESLIVEATKE